VHPNHLARLFRRFGGTTFAQALRAARLQRAQALMDDPRLKLAAVARFSGFASASHLVRCYRLVHGRTPGRERAQGSSMSSRRNE
jgi:transcriptional regulator GlxA family with amidase domain